MKNNTENSGIDNTVNVLQGAHFCQFYQAKEDLMDIVIPYLRAALENNEACIWITPQSLDAEDAKEALISDFPGIDIFLRKGQIEIISCANWFMREGAFDSKRALRDLTERIDKALASGYNGLILIEDICRPQKGIWNDLTDYEREVEATVRRSQATVEQLSQASLCILPIMPKFRDAITKYQHTRSDQVGSLLSS